MTERAEGNASTKPRLSDLIADDDSAAREGLVSLIQRNKAAIIPVGEASNGREALDLWKEHRPDVTLLDLRMPELDGVDAINEIRAEDENAFFFFFFFFFFSDYRPHNIRW